eukprot:Transcript_28273.p1 GENE.Transcript_28273~~Transcript_28273.p1  ORF type:complete len:185 (-),score=48.58 Transcript_28273:256-810(-)
MRGRPPSPPGCWGLQAAPPPRCARRLQVGAVGTLVATFIKRDQVKDRLKCVYCDGTGIIQCGKCLGSSQLAFQDAATGVINYAGCGYCEASGSVVCINCQGSGLNVPDDFVQALGDSESGFSEDDYIGLFDEVKFPDASKQSSPLATVVNNLATAQPPTSPSGTTAPVSSKEIEERVDLTGGMG